MYIGLDLGTSALKGVAVDKKGNIIREKSVKYGVSSPKSRWSEQDPAEWINAVNEVIAALSDGYKERIKGICVCGQMHGLVMLDKNGAVIRRCILWNDGRAEKETERLNDGIGKDELSQLTANVAFAGFTAPKILWVKKNEPENFEKINKIMLPKDYVVYKLTGKFSSDYSDASGTLLLDVKNKRWSKEMCDICSVDPSWLPELHESYEIVGKVLPEYDLKKAVVVAGAGDNAAAAIGTGTLKNGDCNVSLGTSGTVFIAQDRFSVDRKNALHSFVHANGKFHLLGCILSAASANKWWVEDILNEKDYDNEVIDSLSGKNDVYFLPYLSGERSPHNDVFARGAFIGLSADTTRRQMSLAVLEGVAFALKDCIESARQNGLEIKDINLCGGGAKSMIWREIIANVLDVDVYMTKTEQGPSLGAAILAMVGAGEYKDVYEATEAIVVRTLVAKPDEKAVENYARRYAVFADLYRALKRSFAEMSKI